MAVYKEEKTNTWRAVYRYTDWNGERKQTQKRGFKTKREAQAWEREQLNKISADLDMTFRSFVDLYTADMKTRLMTDDKKKMTAHGSSVGADDGQSISTNSKFTIPDLQEKKQFPGKRFRGTLPENAPHE